MCGGRWSYQTDRSFMDSDGYEDLGTKTTQLRDEGGSQKKKNWLVVDLPLWKILVSWDD